MAGCPTATETDAPPAAPPTVRILILEDRPLADAIEREWTASERGELDLTVATAESLDDAKRLPADCIIYPTAMLGELAERDLIAPLPESTVTGAALNRKDIFPLVRRRETTWGSQVYGVPFGSPALVLLYRSDVLAALDRQPPATWEEYAELTELMERSDALADVPGVNDDGWQPAVEPLAPHWAGQMLLGRAAGYAQRPNEVSTLFDYETMEPLIAGPPFVRALSELLAVHERQPDFALEMTPAKARRWLLSGKCAMAITWPTRHVVNEGAAEDGNIIDDLPLGCAPLPGSDEVYDFRTGGWETLDQPARVSLLGIAGRVGSVSRSARHTRAAADTLVWLAGADKGPLIAAHSDACAPCRSSQVRRGGAWVHPAYGAKIGRNYASLLQENKSRPQWLFTPRLPGRDRYLSALDDAVKTALIGEKTPEVALSDAADRWQQITEELGLQRQKDAYARSLGLGL